MVKGVDVKKIWIFIFIILLFFSFSYAEKRNSFLGFKLGDSLEECKKRGLIENDKLIDIIGQEIIIISKNKKNNIEIDFYFFKNKLYVIDIIFITQKQFLFYEKYSLKNYVESGYMYFFEFPYKIYNFIVDDTLVTLGYNYIENIGHICYEYIPILSERKNFLKQLKNFNENI